MLDKALDRAGVDRSEVYVANAVKHFRFEREGKRRIHKTPGVSHIRACRHWLDGELAAVRPSALATLGATAAKALLGSGFKITMRRGEVLEWEGHRVVPTVHPSSILRGPPEAREEAMAALVADHRVAARGTGARDAPRDPLRRARLHCSHHGRRTHRGLPHSRRRSRPVRVGRG